MGIDSDLRGSIKKRKVSPCKRKHFIPMIILLVISLFPLPSVHATEYYAFRLSSADCTLCHTDPKNGLLNPVGIRFREEGYRYPFTWKDVLVYFLAGSTAVVVVIGLYRRVWLWSLGKAEKSWYRWKERWKGFLVYVLGQKTTLRSLLPGISHLLIFGSFFILTLAVFAVLIQEYLTLPLLDRRLLNLDTYPYFRLLLDLCGTFGLVGTLLLAYRRYVVKPRELDNQRIDALSLSLLFLVFLTGFSATGIRNQLYLSPWSRWSPVASGIGWIFSSVVDEESMLKGSLSAMVWVHLSFSLLLLSTIPFSRLLHLFSSPLNIFLRNLGPKGALSLLDLETSETYGAGRIEELTWRNLLELDACTRCGRCQEACPAYLSQKALNPKKVIQDLKRHMERSLRGKEDFRLIGDVVTEEVIWQCTTCRNCLEHCPVFIEPMIRLMDFRRNLVLHHGKVPRETRFAFRNIERKGNPWGFDSNVRMWWMEKLGAREVQPGEGVDTLFWVGCYGSYDDRNIEVATSMIRLLNQAGIDFGVLGKREWCCGTDLRRMGSEYLFQVNVKKNIEQLTRVKFNRILTTCPHCFNTLKNEYPPLGGRYEVIHYTSLLDQLIRAGRLPLLSEVRRMKVTFHDSCYLGRYNDGYEPPRRILSVLPDLTLSEMKRSREKGFCCGGGGCHMWMEEKAGRRINEMRVEQAVETGAQILATVCPLCMISLESAVKVLNLDKKIRVMDILELVGERMTWQ
jgi:Fe-S oxidoreductase/nitrate reductase gamma subunit